LRGSVNYQITRIFKESGIFQPGTSRHAAKQEALSGQDKATPSHVAAQTAIYSYSYAENAKDTWHKLGHHARAEYNLRDMTRLGPEHVRSFLESRIEAGIRYDTFAKEAAHIGKLENALKALDGQERGLREATSAAREVAKQSLDRSTPPPRSFQNPERVLDHLSGDYHLIGRLQLEGGMRQEEASLVRPGQLGGIRADPATGKERGVVHLTNTKGGKPREARISPETYRRIEARLQSGSLKVAGSTYRGKLAQAARAANEEHSGSHSLRYVFAAERYHECMADGGMTHEQAMQQTSWDLGHERAGMTAHYLR
jgi:integrase